MKSCIQKIIQKIFGLSLKDHFLATILWQIKKEGYILSHIQKTNDKNFYYIQSPEGIRLALDYFSFRTVFLVFIKKNYNIVNFYLFHKEDYIVIDFGLNRAYSALYFAHFDNCKKIYGYELVPSTYQKAMYNINLNPHLSHKIEAYNIGVSDEEKEVDIYFDTSNDDGSSLFEIERSHSVEKAYVKSTYDIVSKIIANHPEEKKVLKFDIEGAEYIMLEQLLKDDLIQNFDILVGETHQGYKDFFAKIPENFENIHLNIIDKHMAEFAFINKNKFPNLV